MINEEEALPRQNCEPDIKPAAICVPIVGGGAGVEGIDLGRSSVGAVGIRKAAWPMICCRISSKACLSSLGRSPGRINPTLAPDVNKTFFLSWI